MISIILQSGLFIWFLISLYLVYNDNTLSSDLRILGNLTNLLMIFYILSNMLNQNQGVLFYGIGGTMLAWYLYYTPQDIANTGYTPLMHTVYVAIDIATIIYLVASMALAMTGYHHKFGVSNQVEDIKHFQLSWV